MMVKNNTTPVTDGILDKVLELVSSTPELEDVFNICLDAGDFHGNLKTASLSPVLIQGKMLTYFTSPFRPICPLKMMGIWRKFVFSRINAQLSCVCPDFADDRCRFGFTIDPIDRVVSTENK